jgi:hypothetical protein
MDLNRRQGRYKQSGGIGVAGAWEIGTLQEAVKIIVVITTPILSVLRWL